MPAQRQRVLWQAIAGGFATPTAYQPNLFLSLSLPWRCRARRRSTVTSPLAQCHARSPFDRERPACYTLRSYGGTEFFTACFSVFYVFRSVQQSAIVCARCHLRTAPCRVVHEGCDVTVFAMFQWRCERWRYGGGAFRHGSRHQ